MLLYKFPTAAKRALVRKGEMKPQKQRAFHFLLGIYWAVITVTAALLLHKLVQALERKVETQQLPDYDELVQFDPDREGGHLRPNLNLDVKGEFGAVHFVTNSKGFRNDREFAYMPSPDVYRILLLGDSYVDGIRTDQKRTIGSVLQEILNARLRNNRHVEVMISGHNNPANAWYYYQEHGHKYHPALVILGLTIGNDFTSHNYRYGFLPDVGANGQPVLRRADSYPYWASPGMRVLLPEAAYGQAGRWEWLEDKEFQLRQWLAERSRIFGNAVPPSLMPWGNRRRHVYATDVFLSLGLFYQPGMPEIQEMYQDMDQMLTGMYQAMTTTGAAFLVVLFPVRIQVAEQDWNLLVRSYDLNREQFDLQKPNQHVLALCQRQSIECLDSLPALRRWYEEHGEPVYRTRGDMHLNERGQRIIAEHIAAYLLSRHAQELRLSSD
jgi:hypothetical protein